MAVRIELSGGTTIRIDAELQTVTEAFQVAQAQGEVLKLEDPDGSAVAINPNQILFIQEESPSDAPPAPRSTRRQREPA